MSFLKAWTAKNVEHIVPEIPPLTLALEVVDYLKECFDGIFILRKATFQVAFLPLSTRRHAAAFIARHIAPRTALCTANAAARLPTNATPTTTAAHRFFWLFAVGLDPRPEPFKKHSNPSRGCDHSGQVKQKAHQRHMFLVLVYHRSRLRFHRPSKAATY
jgi:hypothetical protein